MQNELFVYVRIPFYDVKHFKGPYVKMCEHQS